MLIISRGQQERVVIGTGPSRVVLTVLSIDEHVVRLGFEADPSIPIDREEIRMSKVRNREMES